MASLARITIALRALSREEFKRAPHQAKANDSGRDGENEPPRREGRPPDEIRLSTFLLEWLVGMAGLVHAQAPRLRSRAPVTCTGSSAHTCRSRTR